MHQPAVTADTAEHGCHQQKLWNQTAWVLIPALSLGDCVASDESVDTSVFQLSHL